LVLVAMMMLALLGMIRYYLWRPPPVPVPMPQGAAAVAPAAPQNLPVPAPDTQRRCAGRARSRRAADFSPAVAGGDVTTLFPRSALGAFARVRGAALAEVR
jgi:hypothetical protein